MKVFKNSSGKEELVLVFDIGSSSVGGMLFLKGNNAPKIIFSKREEIKFNQKIDINLLLQSMLKSLEKVASAVSVSGLGSPGLIFCFLSSPWYLSEKKDIFLNKNTQFVYSKKLASELIQKEINSFTEECKKRYAGSNIKMTPLEFRNMQTMLNGYVTEDPMDKKASSLKMSVFISMAEETVLEKIRESIGRHFYPLNIKFSSFLTASFAVVRNLFINQENFVLIDIGGEITEVSIIKKNVLDSSASFPLGKNFFTRNIATTFDCSVEESISYLYLYKDGHASDSSVEKINPIIQKLKNEWLFNFQESLSGISNDISIPSTIFLTTDGSLVDFFAEIIKSEQFNQYTLTESKFKVIFLGAQALFGIAIFGDGVEHDSFMTIESIYVNNFLS